MKYKGQTLIEVIIATLIISVALVGITGIFINSLVITIDSRERTQATFLAQDAIDKISAIRNTNLVTINAGVDTIVWDTDFYTDDGYYSSPVVGTPTGTEGNMLKMQFIQGTEIDDGGSYILDGKTFTRYIQVTRYNDNDNQREIDIKVAWPSSRGTEEVKISTVIANSF